MDKYLKPTLQLIGLMLLYYVINVFFIIIGGLFIEGDLSTNVNLVFLIMTQLSMLAIIFFMYKKQGIKNYLRLERPSKKTIIWSLVAGISTLQLSALIIGVMTVLFPAIVESYAELIEQALGAGNIVLVLIAAGLLAPVFEEVLLRGILFRKYEGATLRPWVIVILSGVLFGLFHLNIVQGVFATVGGILFALVFLWTKTLWAPILMHLANNVLASLLGYLPESVLESPALGIVLLSLLFVGLPISMKQLYNHRVQEENSEEKGINILDTEF